MTRVDAVPQSLSQQTCASSHLAWRTLKFDSEKEKYSVGFSVVVIIRFSWDCGAVGKCCYTSVVRNGAILLCTELVQTGENASSWDLTGTWKTSLCLCVRRSGVRKAGRVTEECDAERQRSDDKLHVGAASVRTGLPAVLRHRPVSR